jgi:hypothetical protein
VDATTVKFFPHGESSMPLILFTRS